MHVSYKILIKNVTHLVFLIFLHSNKQQQLANYITPHTCIKYIVYMCILYICV